MADLTLGEIKVKVLKKLNDFDPAIANYTDDTDLLARFNDAIDEAVKFAFYGKSETEIWHILHGKSANAIITQDDFYTSVGEDISFTVEKAYSYYFEVDDECSVEISQNGTVRDTVTLAAQTGDRVFTAKTGLITNVDAALPVTITFKGGKYYNFQNVALYGVQFSSVGRIPAFSVWVPHTIPSGLYQIKRAFKANGDSVDYRKAGDSILIRYDEIGDISIESSYFPDPITAATTDDTPIDIPEDLQAIVINKACAILVQKNQGYVEYLSDVEQAMQMLDSKEGAAAVSVVKLFDI